MQQFVIANLSIRPADTFFAGASRDDLADSQRGAINNAITRFIAANESAICLADASVAIFPNGHSDFVSFVIVHAKAVLALAFYPSIVFAHTRVAIFFDFREKTMFGEVGLRDWF